MSISLLYTRYNRLAWALLIPNGLCRIYYVFEVKARLPFNILFLQVSLLGKKSYYHQAARFRKPYRSCNRFARKQIVRVRLPN